jgi:hypothetical protein
MNAATIRKASWAKRGRRGAVRVSAAMPTQDSSTSSVASVLTVSVLSGSVEFWARISQKDPKSTPRSWLNL